MVRIRFQQVKGTMGSGNKRKREVRKRGESGKEERKEWKGREERVERKRGESGKEEKRKWKGREEKVERKRGESGKEERRKWKGREERVERKRRESGKDGVASPPLRCEIDAAGQLLGRTVTDVARGPLAHHYTAEKDNLPMSVPA